MSGFQLPYSYDPVNPVSVDIRLGKQLVISGINTTVPFASIAEANSLVLPSVRFIGLTVVIDDGSGSAIEYWWKSNTTNAGLVFKTIDAVDRTTDQTIGGVKTFTSSPIVPTSTLNDNSTKAINSAFGNLNYGSLNASSNIWNNSLNAFSGTLTNLPGSDRWLLDQTGLSFANSTSSTGTTYYTHDNISFQYSTGNNITISPVYPIVGSWTLHWPASNGTVATREYGASSYIQNGTTPANQNFNLGNGNGTTTGNLNASVFMGTLQTNPATLTSSNLYALGSSSATTTLSSLVFGGLSQVDYRVFMRGSTSMLPVSGHNAAGFIIGTQDITSITGATYPVLAQQVINPLSVTDNGGTVNNTASLYINGASSATVTGLNYGIYVAGSVPIYVSGDTYSNTFKKIGGTGTNVLLDDGTVRALSTFAGGTGSVTSLTDSTANGVAITWTNRTTTPSATVVLGAITPSSVAATGTVTGSNLSGTNTGDQTSVTGNAGTATVLQTPRTINGQSFDGSSNISIPGTSITGIPNSSLVSSNIGFGTSSTGTDITWSTSPVSLGGTINLNVPTASAIARGALSSADWSSFSAKQGAISFTTTGTTGISTFSSNALNIPQVLATVITGYVSAPGTVSATDSILQAIQKLNGNQLASDANDASSTQVFTNKSISGTTNTFTNIPNSALSNSTISFTLGTSGTDTNWVTSPVSLGGTIQLNIPDASASARGVITTSTQTIAGDKTLTGVLNLSTSSTTAITGTSVALTTLATANNQTFRTLTVGAPSVTLGAFTGTQLVAAQINGATNLNGNVTFFSTSTFGGVATLSTTIYNNGGTTTTSTNTQQGSFYNAYKSVMWNGTSSVNMFDYIADIPSNTVNGVHRLSFVTNSTSATGNIGGTENLSLYSSGNSGFSTGGNDPLAVLGISVGSATSAQLRLLTQSTAVTPAAGVTGGHWWDGARLNVIDTATTFKQYAYLTDTVIPVVEVTTTTQAASVNTKYIANNASTVTITLPTIATQGQQILIRGKGAGGWKLNQNSGQTIHGATDTTTGTGGSIASQSRYDTVALECITANTDFIIISNRGTLTIT